MLKRRRSLAQVQGRMGLFFTKDKPIEPYMGKFDQRSDFKLMHSTHRNSRTEQISGARRRGGSNGRRITNVMEECKKRLILGEKSYLP